MTTILSGPLAVHYGRLCAIRGAVRLEAYGMRRRGKSAAAIARTMFGLGRSATYAEIIGVLDARIKQILDEASAAPRCALCNTLVNDSMFGEFKAGAYFCVFCTTPAPGEYQPDPHPEA